MKSWIKIVLLIFITWLLDQAGWLSPLLILLAWITFLLLIVFILSFTIRPRFFHLLKESLKDVRGIEKHKKKIQKLESGFADAAQLANDGKLETLLNLAIEHDLGDAWFLLANIRAKPNSLLLDQQLATEYFRKGSEAKIWIKSNLDNCLIEWEKRQFFGIGCVLDYLSLAALWEQSHFTGYQREAELAWIYANTRGTKTDFENAWYWLMLGHARWGEQLRPVILSEESLKDLRILLEKSLTKNCRIKLEKLAIGRAHQEFVFSR